MFKILLPENIEESLYIWNPDRVDPYFKLLMNFDLKTGNRDFLKTIIRQTGEFLFEGSYDTYEDLCYRIGCTCMFVRSIVYSLEDRDASNWSSRSSKSRGPLYIPGLLTRSSNIWLENLLNKTREVYGLEMEYFVLRTIQYYSYSFPYFIFSRIEITSEENPFESVHLDLRSNFNSNITTWTDESSSMEEIRNSLFTYAVLAKSLFR
jgi:hypothetical protein